MRRTVWIINQYASTPETGMGGRHYYFAKELASKGYNVKLIAASFHHLLRNPLNQKKVILKQCIDGFDFLTLKVLRYPSAHHLIRVFNWFYFAWRVIRLKQDNLEQPNVIICSSPSLISYLGARYLKKIFQCPMIFEVRDIWPRSLIEIGNKTPRHPFIKMLQKIEDMAYKESDKVISNLPLVYKHMVERGMSKSKFKWIPNGYCQREFSGKLDEYPELKSKLPKDKFIVGYCGTIGLANNLSVLIEAAKALQHYPIHFVIVGDGSEKEKLISLSKTSQLNNVTFITRVRKDRVYSVLNLFDICFIAWNQSELYKYGIAANKIPEYLASGKPIINVYSGEGDLVSQSHGGILVKSNDLKSVCDAILKLYHMTSIERAKFGENGRRYAEEHLEYGTLADKLIGVIESCET